MKIRLGTLLVLGKIRLKVAFVLEKAIKAFLNIVMTISVIAYSGLRSIATQALLNLRGKEPAWRLNASTRIGDNKYSHRKE